MINWKLASNPWNWLTVLLMFYIGAMGVDIISRFFENKGN